MGNSTGKCFSLGISETCSSSSSSCRRARKIQPVNKSKSPKVLSSKELQVNTCMASVTSTSHPPSHASLKKNEDRVINDAIFPEALHTIKQDYTFKQELRRGRGTIVSLCLDKKTGQSWACKTICKKYLHSQTAVADVRFEVEIMQSMAGNPKFVELHKVYEDKSSVYLIMELCENGDLAEFLSQRRIRLPESMAATVFKDLVEAVSCLASQGILHRDIKPENILLNCQKASQKLRPNSCEDSPSVKLADFGVATKVPPNQKVTGMKGTIYYFAPEMLCEKAEYGMEVDVWALGVTLFVLLTNELPFREGCEKKTFEQICKGKVDFERTVDGWSVSKPAINLVRRMLEVDPSKRATLEQVIRDPWLSLHCRK